LAPAQPFPLNKGTLDRQLIDSGIGLVFFVGKNIDALGTHKRVVSNRFWKNKTGWWQVRTRF